jgi:prepilin-type N-terminal cleavage/methylation domain-containing protein
VRTGFTFLELVVVLALLAVISAMIVPVYVRSMNAIQMRSARNGLIGTLRFIQELSVKESREYRLYVDAKNGSYWVMRMAKVVQGEKNFEPITEAWGAETKLPDRFVITNIKARKEGKEKALFISCQPNGASDQAVITVRDGSAKNRNYKIVVHGPMGKIEVQE